MATPIDSGLTIAQDARLTPMALAMKSLGLTAPMLADALSKRLGFRITDRAVSFWRNGTYTPRVNVAVAIGEILGESDMRKLFKLVELEAEQMEGKPVLAQRDAEPPSIIGAGAGLSTPDIAPARVVKTRF